MGRYWRFPTLTVAGHSSLLRRLNASAEDGRAARALAAVVNLIGDGLAGRVPSRMPCTCSLEQRAARLSEGFAAGLSNSDAGWLAIRLNCQAQPGDVRTTADLL